MSTQRGRSRILGTAAKLTGGSIDPHRFLDRRVLLRAGVAELATENGRTILRTAARLLIRCCAGVTIVVADPVAAKEIEGIVAGADAEVVDSVADLEAFDAILSISPKVQLAVPDTACWSDGWCAQVSSVSSFSRSSTTPNAVGAVAAACLGVGEVFKRLIGLRPKRGRLLDAVSFSLYDYSGTAAPGPDLGSVRLPRFLQVGAGAIGNGIALTLIESLAAGEATILDYQDFEAENWGTCVLMDPERENQPKSQVLADLLSQTGRFRAVGLKRRIEEPEIEAPPVVLSALDSPEARHALQLLWPDIVIDGAIGDLPCEVGVHPWGPDVACLRCWYQLVAGRSSVDIQVAATGLPAEMLTDPDAPITKAHVEAAPAEQRGFLRERLGEPVCSVVAEAVAVAMSSGRLGPGFEPSVPFIACFSAAMMVGELFKLALGLPTPLEPRFQFDFGFGPLNGLSLPMRRLGTCDCVRRRAQIEIFRELRANGGKAEDSQS